MSRNTSDFISPLLWPPNSPDLIPMDYEVWGMLQQSVYHSRILAMSTTWNSVSSRSGVASTRTWPSSSTVACSTTRVCLFLISIFKTAVAQKLCSTGLMVPKCPDSSAPVSTGTVWNCLDLQHTFIAWAVQKKGLILLIIRTTNFIVIHCTQKYMPRTSHYTHVAIILGVKTLRTQDTSDPRHFGTIRLVPKCPDSSALVPNCLDLDHTFLVYVNFYIYNITHLLLSFGVCVYFFGYFLHESEMIYICIRGDVKWRLLLVNRTAHWRQL